MKNDELRLDDFLAYFAHAPTALAIKECVRLHAMRGLECPSPILDVGCGDGLFAKLAFEHATIWGIDIDANEGRRAQASRAYSQIVLGDITTAHLPESFFASCVANCSLEHVPDIGGAARTILRALRPGGIFVTFVPNRDWAEVMITPRILRRAGLPTLASALTEAINVVFKHAHLEDAEGWRRIFADAGFEVDEVEPVGTTASTIAFELFLLPSLVGWLNKRFTSRWTISPELRSKLGLPIYVAARSLMTAIPEQAPTAEFMLVARRPA